MNTKIVIEFSYAEIGVEEPGNFVYATLGPDGGLRPTDLVVGKVDPAMSGLKRRIRPSQTTDDEDSPLSNAPLR